LALVPGNSLRATSLVENFAHFSRRIFLGRSSSKSHEATASIFEVQRECSKSPIAFTYSAAATPGAGSISSVYLKYNQRSLPSFDKASSKSSLSNTETSSAGLVTAFMRLEPPAHL